MITCSQAFEIISRARSASITELVAASKHCHACRPCWEKVNAIGRSVEGTTSPELDAQITREAIIIGAKMAKQILIDPEV